MGWTKQDDKIYTRIDSLQIGSRVFHVAFRIDGREGRYRVDKKTLSYMPWEAIDGGHGFATVKLAKAFVRTWKEDAVEQATLDPRQETLTQEERELLGLTEHDVVTPMVRLDSRTPACKECLTRLATDLLDDSPRAMAIYKGHVVKRCKHHD